MDEKGQFLFKFIGSGHFYDVSQAQKIDKCLEINNVNTYSIQKSIEQVPIPCFDTLTLETLLEIIIDPLQNINTEYLQVLSLFWIQIHSIQEQLYKESSSVPLIVLQYLGNAFLQQPKYVSNNDDMLENNIQKYALNFHIQKQRFVLFFIQRWINNVQNISPNIVDNILITYYRFCQMQNINVVFNDLKIIDQSQIYEIKSQLTLNQLLQIHLFKDKKRILVTKDSIHSQFLVLIQLTIYKFTRQNQYNQKQILFGLNQNKSIPKYLSVYLAVLYSQGQKQNKVYSSNIESSAGIPTSKLLAQCIQIIISNIQQPQLLIDAIVEYLIATYSNLSLNDIILYLSGKQISKYNSIQQLTKKMSILEIVYQFVILYMSLKEEQIQNNEQSIDLIIDLLTLIENKQYYIKYIQDHCNYNAKTHVLQISSQYQLFIKQLLAVCIQNNLFLIIVCIYKTLVKFHIDLKLNDCTFQMQDFQYLNESMFDQIQTASSLIQSKYKSQGINNINNSLVQQNMQRFSLNQTYTLKEIQQSNCPNENSLVINYDHLLTDDRYYMMIQEKLQATAKGYLPNIIPLLNQMKDQYEALFNSQEQPFIFQYKFVDALYRKCIILLAPQLFFNFKNKNQNSLTELLEQLAVNSDVAEYDLQLSTFQM